MWIWAQTAAIENAGYSRAEFTRMIGESQFGAGFWDRIGQTSHAVTATMLALGRGPKTAEELKRFVQAAGLSVKVQNLKELRDANERVGAPTETIDGLIETAQAEMESALSNDE